MVRHGTHLIKRNGFRMGSHWLVNENVYLKKNNNNKIGNGGLEFEYYSTVLVLVLGFFFFAKRDACVFATTVENTISPS